MIEYGIVEDFYYTGFSLVFKKLFIEYNWYNKCARIVYFKEDIEYSNNQDCFFTTLLKHRKIRGVDYNPIFKLDFFNKKMGYELKITGEEFIFPHHFKYYIISLKE